MSEPSVSDVNVDGIRINYAMTGDQGPVVLLVHGFPLDHSMWQHQLSDLSDVARLIAPDLRGFGKSEAAGDAFTMESLADELARLLDALSIEEPVVYCGLSMGGYIGWQFWRRHRSRLAGLVCCDTRAAADAPEVARGRELMASRVRTEGSKDVSGQMIPKLFAKDAVQSQSEAVTETTAVIDQTSAESIARGQLAMSKRVDATEWMKKIDVPTLMVVGAEDVITTPNEMREMAENARAEFFSIDGAGHMAPVEKPAEFNAKMREFLAKLDV